MFRYRQLVFCLLLACSLGARAVETNLLVWHKAADRVDANVRGETLLPLLRQIAAKTGWRVYVEPGTTRTASAKFKNLPSIDALRRLLGDLGFVLESRTNGATRLYVFHTVAQNATQLVHALKAKARHVPNELLVKLKLGANIDALAKLLGAKVVGRMDKFGIYRLQFADAAAADAALAQLRNNSDVADVGYNYYFDSPTPIQSLDSGSVPPFSLRLTPDSSGKTVVGLIDTGVQSLGPDLDKFILKQLSVAGDTSPGDTGITHGTAMAKASGGDTSAQILPVDVYPSGESTTTWDVALGIQAAVDNGANVLNLSLGGSGDSSVLDGVIQQAIADGIPVFAAAGNTPGVTTYPAATPGVIAVTALSQNGQLASYANYGIWVDLAFPGSLVFNFNGQAYFVQGTSVSTAFATGVAAGNKGALGLNWTQVETAMQKKFIVPAK